MLLEACGKQARVHLQESNGRPVQAPGLSSPRADFKAFQGNTQAHTHIQRQTPMQMSTTTNGNKPCCSQIQPGTPTQTNNYLYTSHKYRKRNHTTKHSITGIAHFAAPPMHSCEVGSALALPRHAAVIAVPKSTLKKSNTVDAAEASQTQLASRRAASYKESSERSRP